MGLLDFLFGKKEHQTKEVQKQETEENTPPQKVKYETKWLAQHLTTDRAVIDTVAKKMIDEDPFKIEYEGKESVMDFKRIGEKVNKYNQVTTVNIDIQADDKTHKLVVEGIELGDIPEDKFKEIQPFFKKDILTAYAYVTGGPYKKYNEEVEEGYSPFGLEIYLQFT